jgi:hypothetical protein
MVGVAVSTCVCGADLHVLARGAWGQGDDQCDRLGGDDGTARGFETTKTGRLDPDTVLSDVEGPKSIRPVGARLDSCIDASSVIVRSHLGAHNHCPAAVLDPPDEPAGNVLCEGPGRKKGPQDQDEANRGADCNVPLNALVPHHP